MKNRLLEVDRVSKEYRLGMIGGKTLQGELASWYSKKRGRVDPNTKIGKEHINIGEKFWALRDLSFDVDRGDALALLGRNGAGKSTMLKLISRITAPTEGEIRVRGHVASLLEVGTGFHPELSGRDNVYLNGAILGMTRAEINRKMKQIIEFSEVEQFIDTPVKRYSSGMHVKLGFAVAANLDPDLMICDEVLAVGDVAFQQKCLGKMSEIAQDGRAVIYVSHNMRTVTQLCNRGIYLEDGCLKHDGTLERAMELYGGSSARSTRRDLDAVPRSKGRGETMRMMDIAFTNTQTMEYNQDDVIEFTLNCVSHLDVSNLSIRLILQNSILSPIGMTETEIFEVRKDEAFARSLRLKLHGIAPGEYIIKMALVSCSPQGRTIAYDFLQEVSRFIVVDDPAVNDGFVWSERVWGNYRLPRLEIL